MEFLKKLLGTMFGLLKKGVDFLRGRDLGADWKKLLPVLGGVFALICAGKSLRALRAANRRAGKTGRGRRGAKAGRGGKGRKKSLAGKLLRKVLLG